MCSFEFFEYLDPSIYKQSIYEMLDLGALNILKLYIRTSNVCYLISTNFLFSETFIIST